MSTPRWIGTLARLFRGAPAPAPAQRPQARLDTPPATTSDRPAPPAGRVSTAGPSIAPAPVADAPGDPPPLPAEARAAFVAWLFGAAVPGAAGPGASKEARAVLRALDAAIGDTTLHRQLLPRAPQLVPQLMKLLRDDGHSTAEIAQRVAKDVALTAEIVRVANSAATARSEPVGDLRHAIDAIGTAGLQRAIARVLLRPIYEVRGDTPSARAAPQVWQDAEAKAQLAAALAEAAGVDALDGYLAGLLLDAGWSAALRVIDGEAAAPRADAAAPPEADGAALDPAYADALLLRRDRLFAALVGPWQIGPAHAALAAECAPHGLAGATSPLGRALGLADRLAMEHVLGRRGALPPGSAWPPGALPAAVQRCRAELGLRHP